jgi:putative DNA primase/helicase
VQRERIGDLCVGRWESILTSLGVANDFLSKKHGPCPICGGKDRYRFDNKDQRGTWYCSHDGAGDGFALLQKMNGWSFSQAAKEVERVLGVSQPDAPRREFTDQQKSAALKRVWKESKPVVEGDPVWIYLVNRAGISSVPMSLRFHPNLRYDAGHTFPAMLAVVTMPDGKASTMHRTWLDGSGGKAPIDEPKKVMSGTIKAGAIRLCDAHEWMGIAEGIETALSAFTRFGVPTWAAISAGGMRDWEPPEGVRKISIFGDNDANFTGQNAAFALAHRLSMRGIETEVRIPEAVGTDWAD